MFFFLSIRHLIKLHLILYYVFKMYVLSTYYRLLNYLLKLVVTCKAYNNKLL